MATLDDVRKLGYKVGLAWGSVAAEEQALADAHAAADPQVVIEQVNQVATDTMQTLSNIGRLPETNEERLQLATQIGEVALSMLTEHVSARVAFHERALEIAKDMPDVFHVSGHGLELYVSCKHDGTGWDDEAQALLDALADRTAHKDRAAQAKQGLPDLTVE